MIMYTQGGKRGLKSLGPTRNYAIAIITVIINDIIFLPLLISFLGIWNLFMEENQALR